MLHVQHCNAMGKCFTVRRSRVQRPIMTNVTWSRFDQSAQQLVVGHMTKLHVWYKSIEIVFHQGRAPGLTEGACDAPPDSLVNWGGVNSLPIPYPLDAEKSWSECLQSFVPPNFRSVVAPLVLNVVLCMPSWRISCLQANQSPYSKLLKLLRMIISKPCCQALFSWSWLSSRSVRKTFSKLLR